MREFILLLLLASSSSAHAVTGNELLQLMNSKETDDRMEALRYMQGVADQGHFIEATKKVAIENGLSPDAARKPCIPSNVTNGQLMDVIRKYLDNHPESRHYIATQEIYFAFLQAWPCE